MYLSQFSSYYAYQSKLERVVQKQNTKAALLLSPIGQIKFAIDQQTFSRFIFYHRFIYIMQHFRDNDNFFLNDCKSAILDF